MHSPPTPLIVARHSCCVKKLHCVVPSLFMIAHQEGFCA
jgi:hypothetical protein